MRILLRSIALLLVCLFFNSVYAAEEGEEPAEEQDAIPDSEIYLYELKNIDQAYSIAKGKNISSHKGYDNQPFFTPGGKTILFASERDGKQTDIYEYSIGSEELVQVTRTEFMEYSPKTSPDNQIITFVRDGENPDQTVWKMNRQTGENSWAINTKEPVGYYHLNHENGDVLIWLRYGYSVQYLNLVRNEVRFVSGHAVPGTPKQVPASNRFSFVHRQSNGEMWIKSFDPKTYSITPIAPLSGTNSDYAWAPNGDIFRAENNILYVWGKENSSRQWVKVLDLSDLFKGTITRLAISPDGQKIALVENR